MDFWVTLLLALAVANLLTMAMVAMFGDASRRERSRRLRRHVRDAAEPMALSDFSGQALEVNAPMQAQANAQAAGKGQDMLRLLGKVAEGIDSALLFQMVQAARGCGMAQQPVTLRRGGARRVLMVRDAGERRLIWWLTPPETAAELTRAHPPGPFQSAPFAHISAAAGRAPEGNDRAKRVFGDDLAPVLAALGAADPESGGRVALPSADGEERLFRVFAEPGEGSTDYFIFPLAEGAPAQGGTSAALEQVPVALAQFRLTGELLWCNELGREYLGGEPAVGTPLAELVDSLGPPTATIVTEAAAGTRAGLGEMVRLRSREAFLQIALTRVRIDQRDTLLAVLTDANELRRLEEQFAQSQKMEAVGKLAGGVAHDFNNLLTAISGHCDLLLLRKDPSHPDYSDLMQIAQNSNRAAALVRQLLAFSRKQTLNPEILSPRDALTDTHYLLDRLVGERVQLHLDFGDDLWNVRADGQQLEQALMNLVVNARDAMDGAGTITIECRNLRLPGMVRHRGIVLPPGEFVEIKVADSGPGIDPEVIDKVFDPFFTTKPKGEGTGLGLSTAYGIVKQSGGYILADNRPGGGACFQIRLPRAEPTLAERAVAVPTAEALPKKDLTGSGSVLLVEDEDPVRAFAARALKLRGYSVCEASSGEEAVEILSDPGQEFDLLISDVVMPGMDGPTFATEARRLRPGLRLIFVSGYAEESFRKNLTETDFMFLPKPFSLNQLTTKVKEALETEAVG